MVYNWVCHIWDIMSIYHSRIENKVSCNSWTPLCGGIPRKASASGFSEHLCFNMAMSLPLKVWVHQSNKCFDSRPDKRYKWKGFPQRRALEYPKTWPEDLKIQLFLSFFTWVFLKTGLPQTIGVRLVFLPKMTKILVDFGVQSHLFHVFPSNVHAFSQPTHLDSVLVVVQHSTSDGRAASGAEVLGSFNGMEEIDHRLMVNQH